MNTPIVDFVQRYCARNALRLHMPGHKGCGPLGVESLDITEIDGADSLFEASGIIAQSEQNASALFGAATFFSTEGSSLCIRAMLYLALLHAKQTGKRPVIAAGRNAHKVFLSAAALLDFEVLWLYPDTPDSYLSCRIDSDSLERALSEAAEPPAAVYLTSPDYLGNTLDVRALAEVCHRHGALLLVDNAHGAYLKFLPQSQHPVDLGADLCCSSAHKTLPVLTGGAYLQIAPSAPTVCTAQAKAALALFGSTSPSYLILQSLDAANAALEAYPDKLSAFLPSVEACKARLRAHGFLLTGDEPLKLTVAAKPYGYTGAELAALLQAQNIVCEFADPDFLVLMIAPETGEDGLCRLADALCTIERRSALTQPAPLFHIPEQALPIRDAALSACETIPAADSEGRILACATVGCPPAVPIVVCGERIDWAAVDCFRYYGIETCCVISE